MPLRWWVANSVCVFAWKLGASLPKAAWQVESHPFAVDTNRLEPSALQTFRLRATDNTTKNRRHPNAVSVAVLGEGIFSAFRTNGAEG